MTRASPRTPGRTQGFSPRLVTKSTLRPASAANSSTRDFELDQTDAYSRLELHHDVDVAFRTHLAADRGPEQRKLLNTITAAYLRERSAVDIGVTELENLVHGVNFIMPSKPLNVCPAGHSSLLGAHPG